MDNTQLKMRITPSQWLIDEKWIVNRIQFIWDFSENNPDEYIKNKLNIEKNDFYQLRPDMVEKALYERH